MTSPNRLLLASLVLFASACGDDGNPTTTPDAPVVDAPGANCTQVTVGTGQEIDPESSDDFILWSGPLTADLGTGGDAIINFEFYAGGTLTGAIDLGAGMNNNYETCAACIRVLALNAAGDAVEKRFFQSGGTMTLTEDPFANQRLAGNLTDVTLIEVTIDPMTFKSTPVPNGACISLGSPALQADAVPAAWTCAKPLFDDGATCNCACGEHDPDCDIAAAPVAGCTGAQVCGADDTCISTCNVLSTPPVGCAMGTCGFDTATQDICYTQATLVDPAVLGAACATATPFMCGVVATVATGICDNFEGDDKICREACDDAADCAGGEVCGAVVGTKGLCITPPTNDTCETATAITIGTPVNGKTGGAISNYNAGLQPATCTGATQAGADVAYTVALTAGQAITVTLSAVSPNFDPSISILGPGAAAAVCNANPVVCLKGADAGLDGAGETFTFTATTAGTHYLIVDTFYQRQGGTFTLNVTSP